MERLEKYRGYIPLILAILILSRKLGRQIRFYFRRVRVHLLGASARRRKASETSHQKLE